MAKPDRISIAWKALTQLGVQPVLWNAVYKLGLVSGHYRRITGRAPADNAGELQAFFAVPTKVELLAALGMDGLKALLGEADELVAGKVRLFGMEPIPLQLSIPGNLAHWTAYETGRVPIPFSACPGLLVEDIKFIWEPARFGWAFALGRAYVAGKDERYPEAFWNYFELFEHANPPFRGPFWMSAQEVALRLMAFAWAGQVFSESPASTLERKRKLAASISAHAGRIPPTMVYARSQQNNHLITEAAGLLTAGFALPRHPQSPRWIQTGWMWLNAGLCSQVDGYGEYSQHSTNYHRLMLQVVLWANMLIKEPEPGDGSRTQMPVLHWPRRTAEAIARATHWCLGLLDAQSGRTPNLGANDGAYILPLASRPFDDYRPVLHSAARAFLNYDLPHGPWDEMSLWLQVPLQARRYVQLPRYPGDHIYGKESWAVLRTAQFKSRPSHADQLHLDLWWRGLNIARDPGTYLYNATPPWDNSLTTALVHNTVTLNGQDQFTRAGRFLYLDWFNAYRENSLGSGNDILQYSSAHYHAYHNPRIRHTRTVTIYTDEHWQVQDEVLLLKPFSLLADPSRKDVDGPHHQRKATGNILRLHWLLPDWPWEIVPLAGKGEGRGWDLRLRSPHGWLDVKVLVNGPELGRSADAVRIGLVRAGKTIHGEVEPLPAEGWYSPTYGVREPVLALTLTQGIRGNGTFTTEFIFPK